MPSRNMTQSSIPRIAVTFGAVCVMAGLAIALMVGLGQALRIAPEVLAAGVLLGLLLGFAGFALLSLLRRSLGGQRAVVHEAPEMSTVSLAPRALAPVLGRHRR